MKNRVSMLAIWGVNESELLSAFAHVQVTASVAANESAIDVKIERRMGDHLTFLCLVSNEHIDLSTGLLEF